MMSTLHLFIAQLRNWQLFVLVAVPFGLVLVLAAPDLETAQDMDTIMDQWTTMMLLGLPLILALYVWIWTIGVVANRSLAVSLRRSTRLLDISMPFVMVYIIFAVWAWPSTVMTNDPVMPVGIVLFLHLVATVLLTYAVIFAARSLGSLDRDRLAGFGRSLLFVLAIIYFPIGLWWIQPRLNSIARLPDN